MVLPFRHGEAFTRFLNAPVAMPVGTQVSEFLIRSVAKFDPESKLTAVVTQRLEASDETKGTPYVLDIDAFRVGEFDAGPDNLLTVLQELRRLKNEFFFALLTDEALEPYR